MPFKFSLDMCERVDCGETTGHPFSIFSVWEQAIELGCGETVCIESLHQFHTYSAPVCGLPKRHDLQFSIDEAVSAAKRIFPHLPIGKTAVFPATIFHGQSWHRNEGESEKRLVDWEMLPPIATVAVLRKTAGFDSVLAIWWQMRPGFPDEETIALIRRLDWNAHVVEVEP